MIITSKITNFLVKTRIQQRFFHKTPSNLNQTPLSTNTNENSQILIEHKQNYAILKLNRPPVNSLNLEFLTALGIQIDKLEENKSINGVILTSNSAKSFSSGLDLMELYKVKPERARKFWQSLQDVWIKLYSSNKVYIAAINAHAPAGGCLLAMSCDYRIMLNDEPYKIGLNETLLGIKAPFWFCDTMINTIGYRESEKALQLGKLYTPQEAFDIKLVDELVNNSTDLMTKAEEQMNIWLQIPTVAREITKSSLRHDTVSKLLSQRDADVEYFVDFITKESIQKALEVYLEQLKSRKAK